MKTSMKALTLVLCAVLLVCASVMGTLAYLTSKTEVVKNTFTVGNVKIDLDETDVDLYGVKDSETRVKKNDYKLIPGHTYVKDPVIHIEAGSEVCYVFVRVVDELTAIEGATTVVDQMTANGWYELPGVANVWYKPTAVNALNAAVDVAVFSSFTVKGDAAVDQFAGKTITVQAYAVQADGFASAVDAYTAAPCSWGEQQA